MRDFGEILSEVRSRIERACAKARRDISEVDIVAVTKTHGDEVVREAFNAGLVMAGENKVQEAMWKKSAAPSGVEWHLIGHLQTNKVRHALTTFDVIHSVDSIRLADKIEAVAAELGRRPRILLEVNVAGEKSKCGLKPQEVEETLRHIVEESNRITVEGFMTMAPFTMEPESSRVYFRALRELRDRMQDCFGFALPRLSMGMSGDFEVAVEEGATWLRLGTVLFGERPKLGKPGTGSRESGTENWEPDDREKAPRRMKRERTLDSYCGEGPTVKILD